jgi:hypothetical protein
MLIVNRELNNAKSLLAEGLAAVVKILTAFVN